VQEEHSSILKSIHLYSSPIANGVADHITSEYYAWIDFLAENQYGQSKYTIELQPHGVVTDPFAGEQRIPVGYGLLNNVNESYKVYDLNGSLITEFKCLDDLRQLSYKGVVIVKHMCDNEVIDVKKIKIR